MNTEFGELAQAQYRSRHRRRKIMVVVGLVLIVLGYFSMAVKPTSDWVLLRTMLGLGCIILGFGMAVLPLLSLWTSGE
jgi:uncharacterized membrane protein HdeD (DUF308 family)